MRRIYPRSTRPFLQPCSKWQHVHFEPTLLLDPSLHARRAPRAAEPGNDLGEINKYVNVYFLLNLKAASIKIFDF